MDGDVGLCISNDDRDILLDRLDQLDCVLFTSMSGMEEDDDDDAGVM